MGKKQLTTLLVILGVLLVVVAVAKLVRRSGLEAPMAGVGEKVLPDFPINEVTSLKLTGPDGILTLRKAGEANTWTVAERDDYRADFSKVSALLRELWELEVVQLVDAGPSQYGRLGLLDPGTEGEDEEKRATLVEFSKGEGEAAGSLLVGKEHKQQGGQPSPFGGLSSVTAGRFLKAGDAESIYLVSETLSSVDVDATQWINKDFFKVENLKSVERISRSKHDDWKLERESEDGEWKLLATKEKEVLDDTKIGSIKSAFSSPRFDDVAVDVEGLGEEATKVVLETFDGFTYTVRVSKELDDRKFHLTVDVDAKLPKSRKAGEDESEEDKKAKDEEFASEQERLKEKLEKEKKLAGHVFLVPNFVASPVLKKRLEITKNPDEEPMPEGETGAAPALNEVGGSVTVPATAVTPPLEVSITPGGKVSAKPKAEAEPAREKGKAKAGAEAGGKGKEKGGE